MVESIGAKAVTAGQSVTRVAAVTHAPETPVRTPAAPTAQLSGIAQQLAASPPVDLERIARIKKAIEDGSFPILPATIADQLLALRLNWVAHDEA